jgi:hypothetical protein
MNAWTALRRGMKRRLRRADEEARAVKQLAIGVAIGLVFGLAASAVATNAFETGKSWQESGADYQLGFTVGAADMILNLEGPSDVDAMQAAGNCLKQHASEWTAGSLRSVVSDYLDSHQDALQFTMASNVVGAINDACRK